METLDKLIGSVLAIIVGFVLLAFFWPLGVLFIGSAIAIWFVD